MQIPQDPAILLSYVNTNLRDFYKDLDDLCSSLAINRETLEKVLSDIGYVYDKKNNRFI